MKVIYSKHIPFRGFLAINLFGTIFIREDQRGSLSEKVLIEITQHEYIHTLQMREMLYVFFYLWYFVEWIIRIFIHGPGKAYHNISFEREAYTHDRNPSYPQERKHYAWLRCMRIK